MTEKTHAVPNGVIHYWMNDFQPGRAVLVFLPGLTADHRLFDKQVEAFESTITCLPGMPPATANPAPL
mgnify:CR=1 FL=1